MQKKAKEREKKGEKGERGEKEGKREKEEKKTGIMGEKWLKIAETWGNFFWQK